MPDEPASSYHGELTSLRRRLLCCRHVRPHSFTAREVLYIERAVRQRIDRSLRRPAAPLICYALSRQRAILPLFYDTLILRLRWLPCPPILPASVMPRMPPCHAQLRHAIFLVDTLPLSDASRCCPPAPMRMPLRHHAPRQPLRDAQPLCDACHAVANLRVLPCC